MTLRTNGWMEYSGCEDFFALLPAVFLFAKTIYIYIYTHTHIYIYIHNFVPGLILSEMNHTVNLDDFAEQMH